MANEIQSFNVPEFDIEELEDRLEMSVGFGATPYVLSCGKDCPSLSSCGWF